MKKTKAVTLCVRFDTFTEYEILKRAARIERVSYSTFAARKAIKAAKEVIAFYKSGQDQRAAAD